MSNAIAALICLGLLLIVMLMMFSSFFPAIDNMIKADKEIKDRLGNRMRTEISPLSSSVDAQGSNVEITLRNEGSIKLDSFSWWDVIVQYYGSNGSYLVRRLSYTPGTPADNEWTVAGIYLNAADATPEVFEPGILNPGEEMVLQMRLLPPVAPGSTNMAVISTDNGVTASAFFTR